MRVSDVLYLQGRLGTDEAIGECYGITRQAVYFFRKKNRIPFTSEKKATRNAKIIDLRKRGWRLKQISDDIGLSVSRVSLVIRERNGLN